MPHTERHIGRSLTNQFHAGKIILFVLLLAFHQPNRAHGQFVLTYLDIGEMHSLYSDIGAHHEIITLNRSVEWPAIMRHSGHYRSKAYWIGVKNWRDAQGSTWPYRVAKNGPRIPGYDHFTPVETRTISKYEGTVVIVDGYPANKNPIVIDEVNPDLPADRMLLQRYRSIVGLETERRIYAYAHQTHDDYHIIHRLMINNGNTDRDEEIELPSQSLNEVLLYNHFRWVGRAEAGWAASVAQAWGKFSMVDIVGDGHQDYPVDFTAVYLWAGYDPDFASRYWDTIGSPLIMTNEWTASDTTGRLTGMSMQGRMVIHADESTTDRSYNPSIQPVAIGWIDSDTRLIGTTGNSDRDYYELGILRTNNTVPHIPSGPTRMYPHLADRIEPSGEFWDPTYDASTGRNGGYAPAMAYGPYQMAFGDTINIVEAEGAAGLSFDAASTIGASYKESGLDDDLRIAYDANGDGIIQDLPWNYDVYKNGSEVQTKNQWVMTARDSMFQFMYRARDVWEASESMTKYPLIEPPRPPRRFEVTGQPEFIDLQWESMAGSPDPESWEVYRTRDFSDNLPYELITSLPGSARSYIDDNVIRGVDYYYYLQGVGPSNPIDARGISGTPGGLPLKSGRYYTQTYEPTRLLRPTGASVSDFMIVPNPIQDTRPGPNQVDFLDIPGECTITIYTEVGELARRIHHTNGGGFTSWDLLSTSRQPIAAGIYLVHIKDEQTGEVDTKKLVILK